MNILW